MKPEDLEVAWNGTIDTARVHDQQRAASARERTPSRQAPAEYLPAIRAVLERVPVRWWTMAQLVEASGYGQSMVRLAVRRLLEAHEAELFEVDRRGPGAHVRMVRLKGGG